MAGLGAPPVRGEQHGGPVRCEQAAVILVLVVGQERRLPRLRVDERDVGGPRSARRGPADDHRERRAVRRDAVQVELAPSRHRPGVGDANRRRARGAVRERDPIQVAVARGHHDRCAGRVEHVVVVDLRDAVERHAHQVRLGQHRRGGWNRQGEEVSVAVHHERLPVRKHVGRFDEHGRALEHDARLTRPHVVHVHPARLTGAELTPPRCCRHGFILSDPRRRARPRRPAPT